MQLSDQILVAGFIVSGLGFLVVIIQLWTGLRFTKAELFGRIYSELHEIHRAFIEYPELRPYFFHNEKLSHTPGRPDEGGNSQLYYRARAVAELFFDTFEHVYVLRTEASRGVLGRVPTSAGNLVENWDNYIKDMISNSQFLSAYLLEVRDSIHPPALRRLIVQTVESKSPGLPNCA